VAWAWLFFAISAGLWIKSVYSQVRVLYPGSSLDTRFEQHFEPDRDSRNSHYLTRLSDILIEIDWQTTQVSNERSGLGTFLVANRSTT
jgi:hypothetical protein